MSTRDNRQSESPDMGGGEVYSFHTGKRLNDEETRRLNARKKGVLNSPFARDVREYWKKCVAASAIIGAIALSGYNADQNRQGSRISESISVFNDGSKSVGAGVIRLGYGVNIRSAPLMVGDNSEQGTVSTIAMRVKRDETVEIVNPVFGEDAKGNRWAAFFYNKTQLFINVSELQAQNANFSILDGEYGENVGMPAHVSGSRYELKDGSEVAVAHFIEQ